MIIEAVVRGKAAIHYIEWKNDHVVQDTRAFRGHAVCGRRTIFQRTFAKPGTYPVCKSCDRGTKVIQVSIRVPVDYNLDSQ